MRFGPFIIMEKGVSFGIADRNGNGYGFLYDPYEAKGVRFEPSFERSRRRQ
jgi:hypothetical protein